MIQSFCFLHLVSSVFLHKLSQCDILSLNINMYALCLLKIYSTVALIVSVWWEKLLCLHLNYNTQFTKLIWLHCSSSFRSISVTLLSVGIFRRSCSLPACYPEFIDEVRIDYLLLSYLKQTHQLLFCSLSPCQLLQITAIINRQSKNNLYQS